MKKKKKKKKNVKKKKGREGRLEEKKRRKKKQRKYKSTSQTAEKQLMSFFLCRPLNGHTWSCDESCCPPWSKRSPSSLSLTGECPPAMGLLHAWWHLGLRGQSCSRCWPVIWPGVCCGVSQLISVKLCEWMRAIHVSWVCVLRQFAALWAMVTMGTAPVKVLHY